MAVQLCRPLDREKRKTLQEALSKVQGLIGAANLGCGLLALPYMVHSGDEVVWIVHGVNKGINGSEVAKTVLKNLEEVWSLGSLVGYWVENKLSAYAVLWGILGREWLSDKGGVQGLIDRNLGIMYGPRQPTVVSQGWNRVDVTVELMTAEAARTAVVQGLVYYGTRRTVHVAACGGGASVARVGSVGGAVVGKQHHCSKGDVAGRKGAHVGTGTWHPHVGSFCRCGKTSH